MGYPGKDYDIEDIPIQDARYRLDAIGLADMTKISVFRLSGVLRLYGFRRENVFHVVWWDPPHQMMTSPDTCYPTTSPSMTIRASTYSGPRAGMRPVCLRPVLAGELIAFISGGPFRCIGDVTGEDTGHGDACASRLPRRGGPQPVLSSPGRAFAHGPDGPGAERPVQARYPGPLPGWPASSLPHRRHIARHRTQVENAIAAGDTKVTIARISDLRSGVPIGVAYAECPERKLLSQL
jgi:hypothetical protein